LTIGVFLLFGEQNCPLTRRNVLLMTLDDNQLNGRNGFAS
jgi:hypothetical protein